ncbi:MAG: hypothetical protein A2063_06035 [Gallionellales bacterium GWA2_60_142]|nr:MAG: hypothetical protein A2063_06035 [Gallionellales bacterium GWA2_60_142]
MNQTSHNSTDASLAILHEIGRSFGCIPNLFQAYAKHPPLLQANWNKVKQLLLNGKMARLPKEVIALLVSHDNGCSYCIAAHSAALKSMGVGERQIEEMIQGNLAPHLHKRDIELVLFARKANQRHHDIDKDEIDRLVSSGYTEAEIVEALGVMELFAGFNRFARAMKIEVDF